MIAWGGMGVRAALRVFVVRNWPAALVVLAIELGAWGLHELLPGLSASAFSVSAVGFLATVLGNFLCFRFNEAYGRWWEARILWGGMVNASRTFARQVVTLLRGQRVTRLGGPEESRAVQRELVRRQIADVHALRAALRREPLPEELRAHLPPAELAEFPPGAAAPPRLLLRQGERLAELLGRDTPEQLVLVRLDETLSEITALQGGMERIKNTVFPDRVPTVSRVFVWLLAVLVPVVFIEPDQGLNVLELAAVLAMVLSFLLVQQMGAELSEPFEGRPNDTPMTALCRTIEIDLLRALREEQLPPPLEPVDGVLM